MVFLTLTERGGEGQRDLAFGICLKRGYRVRMEEVAPGDVRRNLMVAIDGGLKRAFMLGLIECRIWQEGNIGIGIGDPVSQ